MVRLFRACYPIERYSEWSLLLQACYPIARWRMVPYSFRELLFDARIYGREILERIINSTKEYYNQIEATIYY